jgi:hypothetical protein
MQKMNIRNILIDFEFPQAVPCKDKQLFYLFNICSNICRVPSVMIRWPMKELYLFEGVRQNLRVIRVLPAPLALSQTDK